MPATPALSFRGRKSVRNRRTEERKETANRTLAAKGGGALAETAEKVENARGRLATAGLDREGRFRLQAPRGQTERGGGSRGKLSAVSSDFGGERLVRAPDAAAPALSRKD